MTQPDKLTIEQVARTLCATDGESPDLFGIKMNSAGFCNDFRWQDYSEAAIAAIGAVNSCKQLEAAEILCRAGDAIFATDESTESAIKAAIQHVSTKTPLPTIDYSESQSTVCPHCQGHWYGCSKNQRLCSEGK